MAEAKDNYLAIALKAVSLIREHDVIFITSASVGYLMAQNIPDNLHIRAATNSIVIAEELRKRDNIKVLLLGGEMDGKGNCYDDFTVEMVKRLRFDKCFLTAACISPAFGMSIQKSIAIGFWNTVIDSSKQSIGLFPNEKIGFDSIVSICPANRLQILITDWDSSEEDLLAFEEQGLDIRIAGKRD